MTFDFRVPYLLTQERDDEYTEEHESFGMIGISRVQGSRSLFGSAIEKHGTYFRLSIKQAKVRHALGRDWYYGKRELIEVDLSAAQFAELITTLNMGDGVPCTIERVIGTRMEDLPKSPVESEKIRKEFSGKIRSLVSFLKDKTSETKELLAKPSLGKKDREQIEKILEKVLMEVQSNAPFLVESFQEATEKVAASAKGEIEAFFGLALTKMGLEAVHDRVLSGGSPLLPTLPASSKDDDSR